MQQPVKYPVGIQDFGEAIRGGYVYVDKAALIWRLMASGKHYFLSRPRRPAATQYSATFLPTAMKKRLLAAAFALFAPISAFAALCGTETSDEAPTPLMYYASKGDMQNVRCLLHGGLDINVPLLSELARRAHELVGNNVDLDATNHDGVTALMAALAKGHHDIARLLILSGANVNASVTDREMSGFSPLMFATANGDADIAKLLIDHGANVNAAITEGKAAGTTALLLAAREEKIDIVRLLLEKGANANAATNKDGFTALIVAARAGQTDLARLLIRSGAGVNVTDTCGRSAAMHAALNSNNSTLEAIRNAGGKMFTWKLLSDGSSCIIEKSLAAITSK